MFVFFTYVNNYCHFTFAHYFVMFMQIVVRNLVPTDDEIESLNLIDVFENMRKRMRTKKHIYAAGMKDSKRIDVLMKDLSDLRSGFDQLKDETGKQHVFVKDCLMNFADAINELRFKVGLPKANLVDKVAEDWHGEDHSEGVKTDFQFEESNQNREEVNFLMWYNSCELV